MVNLVGAEKHTGAVYYEHMNSILKMSGVIPHIYGKKETRPFRKMGHVTIISDSIEDARKKAKEFKSILLVQSKNL